MEGSADIAFPCATQNEVDFDDAMNMVKAVNDGLRRCEYALY